jgi:hypothetical protein
MGSVGPVSAALLEGYWLPSHRCDPRAIALYFRHYSSAKGGRKATVYTHGFTGQGEDMVLLTPSCDALFVWKRSNVKRLDGQGGVNCSVFRNEGPTLSSELIRQADELAWGRWPGERLWTYVDPREIRSTNPGYCFLMAGWRRCSERSKARGLVILECLP